MYAFTVGSFVFYFGMVKTILYGVLLYQHCREKS